ncbi:phosphatase PAP2 family protein [Paenisporosarcina macmurdoensis]|uniref:Phosphatase PAP2 family protein n=1 Tax=Paenisporosarcina macmurdoensis TaxID=212659 RepID=A0ABW1LDU8_9BACL
MKKLFYPLAFVTLIGFMTLFFNFTHEEMQEFDEKIGEVLIGNEFIRFFHYMGEPIWIASAALILIVYLAFRRNNYRGMLFVLFTVAGGNFLNHLMKEWIQRVRPDIPNQLTSYCFPSNHAMLGLLYLFTYAYLLTENKPSTKWRLSIWISAIVLTLLIGLSRVAGNNHYGTDVVAGWMFGYSFFILVVIWYEWRNRNMSKRKRQPE